MRNVLAVAAALAAMATQALAQQSEPAASDIPPSACAAFTSAPPAPDGATATAAQMREAVAEYEAWRAQTQATLDCRAAEVNALNAQARARTEEYRAAQADNAERAAAFQAQLDVFQARQRR
jgi:hypothetical protein